MSGLFEHPRQPDEPWYSILREIFRWLAAPFFGRPGPVRVNFDGGAVKAEAFDPDPDQPMFLQSREQPVKHARLRPTAQAGVDRVPVSEPGRQSPPFAAFFGDMEHRIDHRQVADPHIPALHRQIRPDQIVLRFAYIINFK